ncbi:MAG TPA: hypothetical protein VG266_05155 [Candidatus Dormibacteraeota bacterium]|nr:hypothetical protein [Candidatus Dormibacteraeota bacterium]
MSRRSRLLAPGVVALAFAGVWVGHTLEYARVAGSAGLSAVWRGPVHGYMLPVGVALTIAALIAGTGLVRAWLSLGQRLDRVRASIAAAWRGRPVGATPAAADTSTPSSTSRVLALWGTLAVLQLSLYVLQENLEAMSAEVRPPGLGSVSGVHWAAPLVHAAVALVLAASVVVITRAMASRRRILAACENLLRALVGSPGRQLAVLPRAQACERTPLERFGRHIWSRPPPHLSV